MMSADWKDYGEKKKKKWRIFWETALLSHAGRRRRRKLSSMHHTICIASIFGKNLQKGICSFCFNLHFNVLWLSHKQMLYGRVIIFFRMSCSHRSDVGTGIFDAEWCSHRSDVGTGIFDVEWCSHRSDVGTGIFDVEWCSHRSDVGTGKIEVEWCSHRSNEGTGIFDVEWCAMWKNGECRVQANVMYN